MQARYVILRLLLEGGDTDLVKVERVTGSDGKPDILVKLDRSLIETRGKPVIRDFLTKLQVLNLYTYGYCIYVCVMCIYFFVWVVRFCCLSHLF